MNRYNSITQTFTCLPVFEALLSTKGTPPADINFTSADMTAKEAFPEVVPGAGTAFVKFALNDHPRILGVGMWCNLADGLVQISTPEGNNDGIIVTAELHEFNAANVDQGALPGVGNFRVAELNQLFDTDFFFNVSTVDQTLDHLRLLLNFDTNSVDFATITVDPDFATRVITFRPVLIIEHSFALTAA